MHKYWILFSSLLLVLVILAVLAVSSAWGLSDFLGLAQCHFTSPTQGNVTSPNEKLLDTKRIEEDRVWNNGLWESHKLEYGSCVNRSLPDNWCLDDSGVPRYVGKVAWPPRKIQHYTHKGFDKCLAGKTVVFIGDSRVRYQFMHLASYLNSQKHMKCQDYDTLYPRRNLSFYDPECYLIDHESKGSMVAKDWTRWYKKSSVMLESNAAHTDTHGHTWTQKSLCDCYRPVPFNAKNTYENRFIQRRTHFGVSNLIYLQNFINLIRLNEEYPPFSHFASTSKRCKTGECGDGNRTNVFEGDLNETMWKILPRLNTTHAFVNPGWGNDAARLSKLSCEMRKFERRHPDIKLYLISHVSEIDLTREQFDERRLSCDSEVLDRRSPSKDVPRSWYWDKLHVLSILNEEYNHQLVEKMCPI